MNELKKAFLLRVFIIINVIAITVPYAFVWYNYYLSRMYIESFYRKGSWVIIALFIIIYYSYSRIYDGFQVAICRISELIYSQTLALIITGVIDYIIIWLLIRHLPNPIPILLSFIAQIILSCIWCLVAHKMYFITNPPSKSVIIYTELRSMESLIGEYGLEKKFEVCKIMTDTDCIENNMQDLEGMETVLLCGVNSHQRNIILKYCINNNIEMYMIPRIGDVIISGAKPIHMFHLPVLRAVRYNPAPEFLAIKRTVDVVFSLLVLILSSPILLIVSILIKCEDGGPVFYTQKRLTKNSKEFKVIKFRSMSTDAEKDGVARLSSGNADSRITKIGKYIRKTRIDELPQLINILVGDMSIVGPRPERPEIVEEYMDTLPEFSLRLQAKAGLTGYAQVYGKYNTIPYDKLLMDLMYIAKPSILEDFRIIFATIKVLFVPESTEGIDSEKTNAM